MFRLYPVPPPFRMTRCSLAVALALGVSLNVAAQGLKIIPDDPVSVDEEPAIVFTKCLGGRLEWHGAHGAVCEGTAVDSELGTMVTVVDSKPQATGTAAALCNSPGLLQDYASGSCILRCDEPLAIVGTRIPAGNLDCDASYQYCQPLAGSRAQWTTRRTAPCPPPGDGDGDSDGDTDSPGPDKGRDPGSNMGPDAICGCDPGGGGPGGTCFLTTAIVHRLGVESDDGPTLMALRAVRDGYMTETPGRRALVTHYYEVAPRIVAAIPAGHSDWDWIASRVMLCAHLARLGREPDAFVLYVDMVSRLTLRWLGLTGLPAPRRPV